MSQFPRIDESAATTARRGQAGNALIISLMIIGFMTLICGALVTYANTSQKATVAYREVRSERYAGGSAVESAINWAASKYNVARDPDLTSADPACVHHAPTEVGVVTVSCAAESGSGSGEPEEGGLLPPEALLLTGRRVDWTESGERNEQPGPYNAPDCKGWWDTASGWFKVGVDPQANDGFKEYSALFKPRQGLGVFLGSSCSVDQSRQWQPFVIDGTVVAAGRMRGHGGGGFQTLAPGVLRARHGCSGITGCLTGIPNRTTGENVPAYLVGTPADSDPARPYPIPANDPTPTDIREAWRAVGFQADGSAGTGTGLPTCSELGVACGSTAWERTTAYTLNASGGLTAISSCPAQVSQTIVFLPGWYRNAEVLNKYTSPESGCADRTFWLAPDPGPDKKLLTDDDRTGAFYFDFRNTSTTRPCGTTTSSDLAPPHSARWCIGRRAIQNPRVVGGTPKDWSPIGAEVNPTTVAVNITNAGTVDSDLSQVWHNPTGARQMDDGNVAHYAPLQSGACFWNILNPGTCPSIDRSIRVRNFTPKVTSGPLDDRLYVSVKYGLVGSGLHDPKIEVRAVSPESGEVHCGTFNLPRRNYSGTGPLPAEATITTSEAQQLAQNCGQVDRINGFEIRLITTGNNLNQGTPRVYLDGVRIHFNSYAGASFPAPIDPTNGNHDAKSDCDPSGPGAQLIFGGESHVFVGDGSLEVCAGPYPQNPEEHQSIGVYGVPAVDPVRPTGVVDYGGTNGVNTPLDMGNVSAIDSRETTLRYGGCNAYCGREYEEGWVRLQMESYSPPAGYTVSKIEARVSYNPKNSGCSALWDCPGRAPVLSTPGCADRAFPKNPDRGPLQVSNWSSSVLYQEGSTNCVSPAQLSSGVQLTWRARADCVNTFLLGWVCEPPFGSGWSDTLDGIELDITLRPTDNTKPRLIPQSGCIVAFPNYNGGEGRPDCAVLKAVTNQAGDNFSWPWDDKEAEGTGRFSIKGTVYAPSAAVEVDDGDAAYSFVKRGAVLRHLRVTGYAPRAGTGVPAIDHHVDRTAAPREATFVACTQTEARRSTDEPCDPDEGDLVLTRARVRFELDPTWSGSSAEKARVPNVVWWSADV